MGDDPAVINLSGAQMGEVSTGGVAGGNLTNIRVSSEQAINLLSTDVQALTTRVDVLERLEGQHANERQAMTRLITMLASESHTVADVQELLERQIDGDRAERDQRRRYLDTMLTSLIVLSGLNLLAHLLTRVFRRSGRAAKP